MDEEEKKRIKLSDAWREAKGLIVAHRSRLALCAFLMLINRLVELVLPASSKYIIDEVVVKGRNELLVLIALVAVTATLLQAITSFRFRRYSASRLSVGLPNCGRKFKHTSVAYPFVISIRRKPGDSLLES